jgi:hypothetical protein
VVGLSGEAVLFTAVLPRVDRTARARVFGSDVANSTEVT